MTQPEWLLTDEELGEAVWGEWNSSHQRAAKAQAKKLVEWIDEKSKAEAKADGLDLEGCEEPNYWQRLKRDVGVE